MMLEGTLGKKKNRQNTSMWGRGIHLRTSPKKNNEREVGRGGVERLGGEGLTSSGSAGGPGREGRELGGAKKPGAAVAKFEKKKKTDKFNGKIDRRQGGEGGV